MASNTSRGQKPGAEEKVVANWKIGDISTGQLSFAGYGATSVRED